MIIDQSTAALKDVIKALSIEADGNEARCKQLQQQIEDLKKEHQQEVGQLKKEMDALKKNAEELRAELKKSE